MQKILYTILLTLIFTLTLSAQNFSTKGTDFWTTFTPNEPTSNGALSVYISSDIDTKGNISIPFETFNQDFIVTAGTTLKIDLPDTEAITDKPDVVMGRGIHITAEDSVSVYILNYFQATADAAIVYPTSTLGKDYYAMGFESLSGWTGYPSYLVVVGTQNNTEVEITPSSATTTGQPANTPFSITLDQGQTYLLQSDTDLTGSRVRSNSPDNCLSFAVMAGAKCTNVGGCPACDHLLEQMPPTTTWGTRFVTVPYKTRKDDLIRIMASEDGTTVTFDGGSPLNLDAGDFYETSWGAATYVEATKPIMIGQYSKGQGCDNVSADPFFIIISPIEQTLDYINFNAFASSVITNYYVNVVVPTDLVNKVKLDDFPQASKFSTLASQPDFSYAQIDIIQGNHILSGRRYDSLRLRLWRL
ncbi:MAG: IgGFc-binding protein [Sphingobacteriales bacterium]|nr:IgGFc-binding protein [Sphingobacteriales bacterium]